VTSLRLMVVSADPLSASALRRALRASGIFDVADGYADGRAPCAAAVARYRPDVVVVDHMDAGDVTLARVRELRTELPTAKLILLAAGMDQAWLSEAVLAGIDAAIAKTLPPEDLNALLREVAAGNVFHAFDAPRAALGPPVASGFPSLTRRELEVLRLVAAGTPNSRIAAQLWIAEQTVKFHLSKVYRKLGVSNRTEASHHAHVHGLLDSAARTGVATTPLEAAA
jgi:DNA-binding NarL/FixJ family response regulator